MRHAGRFEIIAGMAACLFALNGGAVEVNSPRSNISAYAPGYSGIIFTQVPAAHSTRPKTFRPGAFPAPYGEGGRLILVVPSGQSRVLTADFESAADPSVSFDGKRILFAGKRAAVDLWNIFEMNADGSDLRQVTRDAGNCRKPRYQPAIFYLNDARPSYQVTFASDAAGEYDDSGRDPGTNLYSVRLDGSGLRRLTYTLSSSFDPFQMQDGRILFSSRQMKRTGLFAIHLDGTDYTTFSGTQGRAILRMACTTLKRTVVFIESDVARADGAGTVGTLTLRRNLHSYKALTSAANGLFHSPSPLPDGSVLISHHSAAGGDTFAIYRLDLGTGRRTLVLRDAGFDNVQAAALVSRPEPDGHSSVVEDDQNWAKLYCLSVYENDLNRAWLPRGAAKRLRVIEGLPAGRSGLIGQRLLGDVALDSDGSFHLRIPPNTPVRLQVLDEAGMALRTSAWIWAKNKEQRGCIGCHEDGERTPENVLAEALEHAAADLTLPPERRRTVEFNRDVRPVLTTSCSHTGCHNGPLPLAWITPGNARTSSIIWAIFGRNTARPWDHAAARARPRRMPPPGSTQLTHEQRQAIVEWIDMGASMR